MPKDIQFPDIEPRYVFERDCIAFYARADARPVECLVTLELLMTRFGAREPSEKAMRQAYQEHYDEIQGIARSHIENGWIDNDNRTFLTTRFTRLTVTYDDELGRLPGRRPAADSLHRMLLEMIGPDAGQTEVAWGYDEDKEGRSFITLRIIDPLLHTMASCAFEERGRDDHSLVRARLGTTWGAILQLRSRNIILKSG